ncbi:uncharacterized protein VTP21DRAFT_4323 [Calcarisporiella thermophila]|uniref:uncharacterized protein n=1 Tax=Calcarisporiella thermophila TaxID=911321 RepID=UPI0037439B73
MMIHPEYILGNVFLLFTLFVDFVGWVVLFGSACAIRDASLLWWCAVFELVLLLAILGLALVGGLWNYHLAIVGFLTYSIVLLTILAQDFAFSSSSPGQAAAGGIIILLLVQFTWLVAFGSAENTFFSQNVSGLYRNVTANPKFATAHPGSNLPTTAEVPVEINATEGGPMGGARPASTIQPDASYIYRAKALYNYSANPEDPNEISFEKDEILDIASTQGKWWQAKRSDGSVGIVPSNYLQLV